jgi:hypothetical protein
MADIRFTVGSVVLMGRTAEGEADVSWRLPSDASHEDAL